MRRLLPSHLLPVVLIIGAMAIALLGAGPPSKSPKRAKPPKWTPAVTDVFFDDALSTLVGERPSFAKGQPALRGATATTIDNQAASSGGKFAWSKLISRETLEDEVKSLQKLLADDITTPAKFKGGGFKPSRKHFTELAFLFAIIAEYDGDIRWKNQAAGVRDLMARAGYNCKIGTDGSYAEAKLRKDDLEQLVQGGTIKLPTAEPTAKGDKVADRPPLMQRLEQAQQQGVTIWTANSSDFDKHADQLLHEAELIAAIGEAIQHEGFEFTDDAAYLGHARQMRDQALEVISAAKGKNYDGARSATGQIEKACTNCHEGFRS